MCTSHYLYRDGGTGEFLRMREDGSLYLDMNVYDAFCNHLAKEVGRRARRQFGRRFQKLRIDAGSTKPAAIARNMTIH